jgi:DNA-binding transcriptional LysR family regulator
MLGAVSRASARPSFWRTVGGFRVERELLSRHPERANGITVTAAEWSVPLLTPVLGAIAARHFEVTVRLRVENRVLDLSRREADVALRVGRPEEAAFSGRRIGVARYGLFGSAAYLRRQRAPRNRAEASSRSSNATFGSSITATCEARGASAPSWESSSITCELSSRGRCR